jgi:RimJ/RimL family protein N-acetyltransferase
VDLLVAPGEYTRAREVKRALLESLFSNCRKRGISHLTARVDAGNLSSIHALESAGCELIDGIQTFSLHLQKAGGRTTTDRLETRMFREDDLPQVLAIARTSYVYDRFHADSALSPEVADAANEDWVRNSCAGTAADSVILACREGEVLSYVTCKIDRETGPALGVSFGAIVMVATAQEARGRGAARAATEGALDWFRGQRVDVVEVGTQIRNIPAGRLYESCGFRLVGVSLTFRRLL